MPLTNRLIITCTRPRGRCRMPPMPAPPDQPADLRPARILEAADARSSPPAATTARASRRSPAARASTRRCSTTTSRTRASSTAASCSSTSAAAASTLEAARRGASAPPREAIERMITALFDVLSARPRDLRLRHARGAQRLGPSRGRGLPGRRSARRGRSPRRVERGIAGGDFRPVVPLFVHLLVMASLNFFIDLAGRPRTRRAGSSAIP